MKGLFIIMMSMPWSLSAQNKISGLGPFKIGQTLSSKIASFADTSRGRLYYAEPTDSFTERWAAGYYQISGLWVEDLDLKFYKDTLYSIECRYSDSLRMALTAKYGEGVIKTRTRDIKCITGLKISYTEQEKTYITSYPTSSKNISAWAIVGKSFDDRCQPTYLLVFNIVDFRIEKKIEALLNAKRKQQEAKEQAALKSKLDKL